MAETNKTFESSAAEQLSCPAFATDLISHGKFSANHDAIFWTKTQLWTSANKILDHIDSSDHAQIRTKLPLLCSSINELITENGRCCPELFAVREAFDNYMKGQQLHLINADWILFPVCRKLTTVTRPSESMRRRITSALGAMQAADSQSLADYRQLSQVAADIVLPGLAGSNYKCWLASVQELQLKLAAHLLAEGRIVRTLLKSCDHSS
jgi:regulator of cell morphogenesis and NO signaling